MSYLYPPYDADPRELWLVAVIDTATMQPVYANTERLHDEAGIGIVANLHPTKAATAAAAVKTDQAMGVHAAAYRAALATLPNTIKVPKAGSVLTLLVCPFVGSMLYAEWLRGKRRHEHRRRVREYMDRKAIERDNDRILDDLT